MTCNSTHRYKSTFNGLPHDQSKFNGRHKCAGCAYDEGKRLGLLKEPSVSIDFDALPDSQAGTVRHKSVQAAFAMGYQDGVLESYN